MLCETSGVVVGVVCLVVTTMATTATTTTTMIAKAFFISIAMYCTLGFVLGHVPHSRLVQPGTLKP
jgi:hypothetical protein